MLRIKKCVRIIAAVMVLVTAFSVTAMADFLDDEALKVIVGKDGWYFYDSDGSIDDYRGTNLYTASQLSYYKTGLKNIEQRLNAQGIEFVILLVPNREHIYSEYMPDEYGEVAPYTRIQQLYDYLKDDLRVIYPMNDLMLAKAVWPQYDFCYKTDTHWNDLGAYIGAQDLLTELGTPLPDLSTVSISAAETTGNYLPAVIGEQNEASDFIYTVSWEDFRPTEETFFSEDEQFCLYHTEGSPKKNMSILGDSFSMAMAPYLGQFYENVILNRLIYSPDILDTLLLEKPSVVVLELVERYLSIVDTFARH